MIMLMLCKSSYARLTPRVLQPLTATGPLKLSKTQSTCSRRPARRSSSTPLATNILFIGTMKGRLGGESSRVAISYSGGPNQQRRNTNCLHHGKVPIR